jgi:hypothetical protein
MNQEEFENNIRDFIQDFEIYNEIKHKCKYQIDEFELVSCTLCPNKKHSMFACPRIHYLPLKMPLIYKHIRNGVRVKR